MSDITFTQTDDHGIRGLDELAKRLGVEPNEHGGYDVITFVNALLDRIDAATSDKAKSDG